MYSNHKLVVSAGLLFGIFSDLKIDMMCSSEILSYVQTTCYYNPDDCNLHGHCCENVISNAL
jgi:hypothetical protein